MTILNLLPASDLGVGKMRTAVAGVTMLRVTFKTGLVTNSLPGRRISFLLLFTGGASSSHPCQSS